MKLRFLNLTSLHYYEALWIDVLDFQDMSLSITQKQNICMAALMFWQSTLVSINKTFERYKTMDNICQWVQWSADGFTTVTMHEGWRECQILSQSSITFWINIYMNLICHFRASTCFLFHHPTPTMALLSMSVQWGPLEGWSWGKILRGAQARIGLGAASAGLGVDAGSHGAGNGVAGTGGAL